MVPSVAKQTAQGEHVPEIGSWGEKKKKMNNRFIVEEMCVSF